VRRQKWRRVRVWRIRVVFCLVEESRSPRVLRRGRQAEPEESERESPFNQGEGGKEKSRRTFTHQVTNDRGRTTFTDAFKRSLLSPLQLLFPHPTHFTLRKVTENFLRHIIDPNQGPSPARDKSVLTEAPSGQNVSGRTPPRLNPHPPNCPLRSSPTLLSKRQVPVQRLPEPPLPHHRLPPVQHPPGRE